jgi:hypothetical protein
VVTTQKAVVPGGVPVHTALDVLGHVCVQKPTVPPEGPCRQKSPLAHGVWAPTVQGSPQAAFVLPSPASASLPGDASSASVPGASMLWAASSEASMAFASAGSAAPGDDEEEHAPRRMETATTRESPVQTLRMPAARQGSRRRPEAA